MNTSKTNERILSSMIIEGFICPECQQDMSSIELLQTHFELFHSNKNTHVSNGLTSNPNSETSLSSVFAKAKTLISSNDNYDYSNANNQSLNQSSNLNQTNTANQNNNSINNINNINNTLASNSVKVSNKLIKDIFSMNQQEGCFRSYTNEFRKLRDNSIGRYVVQTNKLLITLDKLISIDLSVLNSENDREIHYKSVVSWVNDKDVHLCPNCAKSFSLLNRKHHCRLCGAIMCNKCSQFISFTLAKQLTDPDTFIKTLSLRQDNQEPENEFKLRRADSITSLNSYFFKSTTTDPNQQQSDNNNDANKSSFGLSKLSFGKMGSYNQPKSNPDQTYLRLCFDCGLTLEKKYKQLKDKTVRSQFSVLYDELHSCISESKRLYPVFSKMAESLNVGESVHQLSNADDMRHNLIRLFQQIESISGRILKYGIVEQEQNDDKSKISQPPNDQIKLQRNIRFYAINYLKENSFNLSSLPNKEEYEKLKAQRQIYLVEEMRRVELEQLKQKKQINDQIARRQQTIQRQSNDLNNVNEKKQSAAKISIDNSNGWIPSVKPSALLEDSDNELNDVNNNDSSEQASNSLDDDGSRSINSKRVVSEQEKALRIQIQLVENYLQDAIKHNKKEEAETLRRNLNELLNALVDTS